MRRILSCAISSNAEERIGEIFWTQKFLTPPFLATFEFGKSLSISKHPHCSLAGDGMFATKDRSDLLGRHVCRTKLHPAEKLEKGSEKRSETCPKNYTPLSRRFSPPLF